MSDQQQDMGDLIARIERADGPSRELDAEIYHDVLGFCRHSRKEYNACQDDTGFDCLDCGADSWGNKSKHPYPLGQGLYDKAPAYTASIDAAMSLVPEEWKLRQINFSAPCADCRKWTLNLFGGSVGQDTFHAEAHTPALALCAAALRAQTGASS